MITPSRCVAGLAIIIAGDRGTMDVKSRTLLGKSSFRRKLLGYFQLWKGHRHTERWGFKSFRVLTITPSEKRLQNMIVAQREIVGATGLNPLCVHHPKTPRRKKLAHERLDQRQGRDGLSTGLGAADGRPLRGCHAAMPNEDDS